MPAPALLEPRATVQLSIRVSPVLRRPLVELAREQRKPVTRIVEDVLTRYVEQAR